MPNHETRNIIEELGKQTQSVNEIWPVYVILENKIFLSKKFIKNVAWKLVPGPF